MLRMNGERMRIEVKKWLLNGERKNRRKKCGKEKEDLKKGMKRRIEENDRRGVEIERIIEDIEIERRKIEINEIEKRERDEIEIEGIIEGEK